MVPAMIEFPAMTGARFVAASWNESAAAAVQPLLSGGVSKTINLAHEAAPEEIEELFLQAWRLGLKSVAVYRQGSKITQPLQPRDD